MLTLFGLIVITWRYGRWRWLAVVPFGLLTAGIFVMFWRPSLTEMQAPAQPFQSSELSMLGYRWEQGDDSQLYVYPYWYVRKTPDPDMRVRLRLYDDTGRLVGWELARPFFNSHQAGNWPPGTIVDDAYALTLVPGLPAGTYELTAEVEGTEEDSLLKTISWGQVEIEATPPSYLPANQSNVRFGDSIVLNGYDLEQNGRPIPPSDKPLVALRGDYLEFASSWMGLQAMEKEYTGFVHLVDAKGKLLVQDDHPAGSSGNSTSQWRPSDQQLDHYELQVPREAPAGVYWPIIGVYDPDTTDLLTVQGEGGEALGDVYKLPPIKILTVDPNFKPQNEIDSQDR